jgi:hypothetical protein
LPTATLVLYVVVSSEVVGLAPGNLGICDVNFPEVSDGLRCWVCSGETRPYNTNPNERQTSPPRKGFSPSIQRKIFFFRLKSGLPDGMFVFKKLKLGYILEGIGMENVGMFYGNLVCFAYGNLVCYGNPNVQDFNCVLHFKICAIPTLKNSMRNS